MTNLKVKTTQPDYQLPTFETWKRHIISELFVTSNKVTRIEIMEKIQPRIKNQLFA